MQERNEVLTYFRTNIFEAKCAHNAWKVIYGSKCDGIVSKELAERYVSIQKYHSHFFGITERALLMSWVILILHSFDRCNSAYSLKKVDESLYNEFIAEGENESMIKRLKALRDKLFAHRDTDAKLEDIKIPSMIDTDAFFDRLIAFYNKLCGLKEGSSTSFLNTEEVKHDIETMFMNLERGESMRLKEIDIEWRWDKDGNKISNKV